MVRAISGANLLVTHDFENAAFIAFEDVDDLALDDDRDAVGIDAGDDAKRARRVRALDAFTIIAERRFVDANLLAVSESVVH